MDVVYTFGHSVDVDGDEWIDLGSLPTTCGVKSTVAPPAVSQGAAVIADDDINNPFSHQDTESKTPVVEPDAEPEEPITKADLEKNHQQKPGKVMPEATSSCLPTRVPVRVPVSISKAAKSKEDLMAFYLDRAKQMEAKHRKIIGSPSQPEAIRSLQESELLAPTGS